MSSSNLINSIASIKNALRYLEIGVAQGITFFNVNFPLKIAVDPHFQFDTSAHASPGTFFYRMSSDDFFRYFLSTHPSTAFADADNTVNFDVIFIDGLHTYEQSLRDFENSLAFAHENTVWILDDTVPNDPYSALPDMEMTFQYRKKAGIPLTGLGSAWHGDVYKTVFAIHDRYKDFSYCTVMNENPQTVIWKTPSPRASLFPSAGGIDFLNYFDVLKFGHIFAPVSQDELPGLIGSSIDTADFLSPDIWRQLLYSPIASG